MDNDGAPKFLEVEGHFESGIFSMNKTRRSRKEPQKGMKRILSDQARSTCLPPGKPQTDSPSAVAPRDSVFRFLALCKAKVQVSAMSTRRVTCCVPPVQVALRKASEHRHTRQLTIRATDHEAYIASSRR